jgi:acetyl esterase/lipase
MMTPADMLGLPQPPADACVLYGPLPSQVGDLRVPAGEGPFPLVVLLHGGCWEAAVDRGHLALFAESLRDGGFASWSVEYRRVGEAGGGWPGTFDDVRAAMAFVPTLTATHPLDPTRVLLLGHSAGAHLALWYASATHESVSLVGVLALAPLTDLARDHMRGFCARAAGALVAGAAADDDLSRAALSPARMGPPRVPVTLVQGGLDRVVTPSHAARYAAAHPERCVLHALPEVGHFELVAPGHTACDFTLAQVRAAFAQGS